MHLTTLSDEDLLQGVLKGDNEAAMELVGRYNSRAVRVVYNRLRDFQQAEDLVQNLWIELLKAVRREFPRRFSSFFWSLLRKRVIDAWRRQGRNRESLDLDAPWSDNYVAGETRGSQLAAESPDPLQRMMEEEAVSEFEEAMQRLPEQYRAAIELRGQKKLSWLDAAAEMIARGLMTDDGDTQKKMKNCFYRAHVALEALMKELSDGGGGDDA